MSLSAKARKRILIILSSIVGVLAALVAVVWLGTYHPKPVQAEPVFSRTVETGSSAAPARILQAGQNIKVLNWNVQYMAGKNYVFWYDEWDGSGPDAKPSRADVEATWTELLRVILDENPDVIILQELHENHITTGYENQLQRLLNSLPDEYAYSTSAWYWKAFFVPLPQLMGRVGMKLAIVSKYQIDAARRHQLPLMPNDPLTRELNFKRAVLEAQLPVQGGKPLSLFSIHMDAFAQGSDTMERQVDHVLKLLQETQAAGKSFAIAGDFNLVPPGLSYSRLPDDEKPMFKPETEISRLYQVFKGYPTLQQVDGPDWRSYLTHFPNISDAPDRVLDYFFVSDNIQPSAFYVRQHDTLHISDHLPTVLTFNVN
ncbi:MAG: endonuclease/exonuclease/phosphatase family protein [Spirochaetes bacterium]|nr:endonuclease/exonuclease/phosphatase family protein [Spirochaetota bacterium]